MKGPWGLAYSTFERRITSTIDREQSQIGVIARVRPLFHGSYERGLLAYGIYRTRSRRQKREGTIGEGFVSFPDSWRRKIIFFLCFGVSQSMCPLWCMSKWSDPMRLSPFSETNRPLARVIITAKNNFIQWKKKDRIRGLEWEKSELVYFHSRLLPLWGFVVLGWI